MKKYKAQLEKFKKCRFSGENQLFRRFLDSSGFKNQFYWQLNHAWWLALLLTTFLCEKKQRNIRKKSDENLQKRRFPGFSAGKKFFSKIGLGHVLSIANAHLYGKNQKKLMMKSRENAKKPVFPVYFRHFRNFSGNRAPSHFGHCHFASLCQKSAKMSQSQEMLVTDRWTDQRTDGKRLIYRTSEVGPKIRQSIYPNVLL